MAIWQPVVFVNSGIFHLCLNKIVIVGKRSLQEVVEESTSALVTSEPYVVVDPEKADGLGSDAFYAWKVWMGC